MKDKQKLIKDFVTWYKQALDELLNNFDVFVYCSLAAV